MDIWPQFRSPLIWDVFAVGTYLTVSLLFWYLGMVPDFASFRDRAKNRITQIIYGVLAMGWRGSAVHWERYEMASLMLAGLATPLVLSVHSVVSLDFAIAIVPGWHTTIFPPYFVAGAIFAGFAMVLTLMIPVRRLYGLQDFITNRHLDNMGKVMLVAGLIVAYGYFMELFISWYSASPFETYMMENRMSGPYGHFYWALILCNIIVPQLLWSKKVRLSTFWLFLVSMFIMWECGWSASSSSSSVFTASSCLLRGTCTTPPSGTGPPMRARSASSFSVSSCSFGGPIIAIHEIRTLVPIKGNKR